MKRKIITMAAALVAAITLPAQTARQFVLSYSDDGKSELHCFLPEKTTGRAVIACPGGALWRIVF